MVLKLILTTALLVVGAEAHCHPYSCEQARVRLQLCLNHGYKPERLVGPCKLQDGDWEMSDIQKNICKDLEEKVEEEKCNFECEAAAEWPGEGWEAVDLAPGKATEESVTENEKELKFSIRSKSVIADFGEGSSGTNLQVVVKFLKRFTKTIHFRLDLELLGEGEGLFGTVYSDLKYTYVVGSIIPKVDLGMSFPEYGKSCRGEIGVSGGQGFLADEGPDVTFKMLQMSFYAGFSGEREIFEDFDLVETCTQDVIGAAFNVRTSTKKIRFRFDAAEDMVADLGEFIAVKYKFIKN